MVAGTATVCGSSASCEVTISKDAAKSGRKTMVVTPSLQTKVSKSELLRTTLVLKLHRQTSNLGLVTILTKFSRGCSNVMSLNNSYCQEPLRKHAYSNILKTLQPKRGKFSDKKFWYFSYFCSKHRLWVPVRTASPRRFYWVPIIYVFKQK